ncbi:TrmO family methyltransferase, partial [Methanoregula sp.]|uniref:TrmO family methyltransferase domain-containing protein n=1 Tax=Methanoregula sp. TaxID=2052170 RepID=UPI000CBBA819
APRRPNAIGLSVVKIIAVRGSVLEIEDVDILDGTPLFDIKPYVPAFDAFPDERSGWLTGCGDAVRSAQSDNRFSDNRD